jgi:hypothetical protein
MRTIPAQRVATHNLASTDRSWRWVLGLAPSSRLVKVRRGLCKMRCEAAAAPTAHDLSSEIRQSVGLATSPRNSGSVRWRAGAARHCPGTVGSDPAKLVQAGSYTTAQRRLGDERVGRHRARVARPATVCGDGAWRTIGRSKPRCALWVPARLGLCWRWCFNSRRSRAWWWSGCLETLFNGLAGRA